MCIRDSCRAKRRYDELSAKGEDCNLEEIEADIRERDERDMTREFSPLRQAEDAVLVDSSDMTVEEVIGKIISLVQDVYKRQVQRSLSIRQLMAK